MSAMHKQKGLIYTSKLRSALTSHVNKREL